MPTSNPRRRSKLPPKRRSKSPPKRRSKSPPKRRSKSPPKRRSKSPPKRRKRVFRGILIRDKVRSLLDNFDILYNDVHVFVTNYAPYRASVDPIKANWEAWEARKSKANLGHLPAVPLRTLPETDPHGIGRIVNKITQRVKEVKREIGDDMTPDVRTLISLETIENYAKQLADMKEEGQTILQFIQKVQHIFNTTFFDSNYRSHESERNTYTLSLERIKQDIESIRSKVKETEKRHRRDFDVELPSSDNEDANSSPRRIVDFGEPPPPPKRGFFSFLNPTDFPATHD